jgi:hypothetical protein
MTRVCDFTAGVMRDEVVRIAAEPPSLGAEHRTVTAVNGDHSRRRTEVNGSGAV